MAISAISGYNSLYGVNKTSSLDYQSWLDKAAADAKALEGSLAASSVSSISDADSADGTASADSSSKVSGSDSSTSAFLVNYKRTLEELETSASELQTRNKDNVFAKYESALRTLSRAETDEQKASAQKEVDAAKQDIVSAVKDFADKYNSTTSFLERNAGRSETVESQLNALKRAVGTDDAMATVGLSIDPSGNLQVNEEALNKALDESLDSVKDTLGGQFGIAERAGDRASSILDFASVESIAGTADNSNSVDDFALFANFAMSGGYNLSNYYAVGALLDITV